MEHVQVHEGGRDETPPLTGSDGRRENPPVAYEWRDHQSAPDLQVAPADLLRLTSEDGEQDDG